MLTKVLSELSNSTQDPLKKEHTQPQERDEEMILSHEVSNPSQVKAGQVSGLDGQGQVADSRRTETAFVVTAPKQVFSPLAVAVKAYSGQFCRKSSGINLSLTTVLLRNLLPLSTQGTKAGPESLDGTRAQ